MTGPPPPLQGPSQERGPVYQQMTADLRRETLRNTLGPALSELGREYSEEAKGFWENTRYQFDAAGKSMGDGVAYLGVGALKGLYMTGGTLSGDLDFEKMSGEFDDVMRDTFHTSDPDMMDLVYGWTYDRKDLEGLTVGQHIDSHISSRLGDAAMFGEAAGTIASFATGPGALLGKGVYSGARPMALVAERSLAKRLARGSVKGVDPELVGQAIRSKEPLRALSMLPEWRKQASNYQRVLAWGGRHMSDAFQTTAALTAQSYAMSPSEERGAAAEAALLTGPLIVPIARVGQYLGGKVMTLGMSQGEKRAAAAVYDDLMKGRIAVDEADDMLRAVLPAKTRQAMGNTVAAAFEGPAFTWLSPDTWKDYSAWLGGDSEAGARLVMHMLGSATGVAVAKYSLNADLAPMFRHVRPDLNSVRTYAEAEAVRRIDGYAERARISAKALAKQGEAKPMTAREGELATSAEKLQQRLQSDVNRGKDSATTAMDADVARYDWADVNASVPLRGGFEPSFTDWNGKSVLLTHRGRHQMVMKEDGHVVVGKDTAAAMEQFGRSARGQSETVLEDAGLIGMLRTMQGNLTYERMGWREVQPGIWADDANLLYHTMALDGKTNVQNIMGKQLPQQDLAAVGGYGEADFHHRTLDSFKEMLMAKSSVSADQLHDGIFNQAVLLAEHGDSVAARSLRKFFAEVDPAALKRGMTPAGEKMLATTLGALGSGTNNAANAIAELTRPLPSERGGLDVPNTVVEPVDPRTPSQVAKDPVTPSQLQAEMAKRDQPLSVSARVAVSRSEAFARRTEPAEQSSAPLERDRLGRLQEVMDARGETEIAARLESILKTGTPEQVRAAVAEHGEGLVGSGGQLPTTAQLKTITAKAKKAGTSVMDWAITDRAEALKRDIDHPWIGEFESARSQARTVEGEAQDLFRDGERALKKIKRSATELVDVEGTPTYRWIALAEGRIAPRDATERVAAEGLSRTIRRLWELADESGFRRVEWDPHAAEMRWQPLGKRQKATVPRMPGNDWETFFRNESSRRRLWEWLIDANKLQAPADPSARGGRRTLRRMTADEMEAQWLDKSAGPKMERGEREAAFEFVRQLRHFPSMFEGNQLLQSSPFEGMRRMIHEQAGRIAAGRVWGQDLPQAARAAIESAEGIRMKAGAESELRSFQRELRRVGASDPKIQSAQDLLVTLQGGSPRKMSPFFQAIAPIEGMVRSGMTMITGIHDIPAPFIQGTAYAGARRMWRAMRHVARSPREALAAAERVGSLMRNMGSHDFREAEGSLQKVADILSWASTKTERIKTAAFDRMAVEMLSDWSKGRSTANDRDVLREMTRLQPSQVNDLLAGKASSGLQNRFRHEFVKLTTGRRTRVEGSEFLASPNVQQVIRFGNWISGRMVEISRAARAMASPMPGATRGARARAMGRMATLMSGWAASGVATTLMYYMLSDLMKGENGAKRWYREMTYAPTDLVMRGMAGQMMGGPTAQMARLFSTADPTARDWANTTSLSSYLFALHDAWSDANAAAPLGLSRALGAGIYSGTSTSGVLPSMVRNLAATVSAGILGEDGTYRSDARHVGSFMRMEEIQRPQFVSTKSAEFYDVMRDVRRVITRDSDLDPEARAKLAADTASEQLRRVLELQQEESVAATIRTFQHLDNLSLEQQSKLADFTQDDEQMQRIIAHDMAIREFASMVGRMHGESGVPIDDDIELAESQARLGDSSVWRPLVDRVLDDAVARDEAGEPLGSDIRQLAESAAAFPQQLEWLTDRQQRSLMRRGYVRRARMIQTILRRRVRDRVRDRKRSR